MSQKNNEKPKSTRTRRKEHRAESIKLMKQTRDSSPDAPKRDRLTKPTAPKN
jgi:hypothetical protein